jgi:kynurenine formamidase
MTEDEVLGLFTSCSNAGRWGADDERGTLNYVTPAKRLEARALIREGVTFSIGRDLVTRGSTQVPPSAVHVLTYDAHAPTAALELLTLMPHGFEMTHLDAVAHSYFEGRVYNGRRAGDVVQRVGGVRFGSIMAHRDGIVTRGVLLDVAAVRGVEFLAAEDGIAVGDLEAAEAHAKTRVGRGDAVFVRSGQALRERTEGPLEEAPREGLIAECVPWLHAREVALYSGDCIERLPSGYERVPMPLHQVGMVAMGLSIMDCVDCERLAEACRARGRYEFCLAVAPLRVPGGTASAVNPLVLF